jgi:uncharacterized membrane protein
MAQNGATPTVVGLFRTPEDADQAVQSLKSQGLNDSQISVMVREETLPKGRFEAISKAEEVTFGQIAGATAGATVGIFAGVLLGLTALAVPGVGPILSAGTFATLLGSAVAGSGVGAVAGGLLVGGLAKMGLSEEQAHLYAEGVKRGGLLLAVHTDEAHLEQVERSLREANAADMNVLQATWQKDDWSRFEETVAPNNNYLRL